MKLSTTRVMLLKVFSHLLVFILKEYAVFIVGVILFIMYNFHLYVCRHISLNFLAAIKNMRDSTSEYRNSGVRCLRISPDGQTLATGDRSGNVRFVVRSWWHWLINRFFKYLNSDSLYYWNRRCWLRFLSHVKFSLYFTTKFKRKRKRNLAVNKLFRFFGVFRLGT